MAARPEDAATRQESTYETSCAETDDVSLADTEQPDYDVNAAWDIDKILAEAEFEDDSDGKPITDDKGEPSSVKKYLVKWTGYSLKSATWQDKEPFVDGAEKILWAWFDQQMNEQRGHKEAFDIGRWEDWCNKVDDVRDERHTKRNKKRKKLGLPVVVYPTDDTDADDEEEAESHHIAARTREKDTGKGKGRAVPDGDELGSGDMDISSSAADDEPLSSRSRTVKVASARTTKRLPFTDSDGDDNDKNQSDGDDIIMTGSARIKRRRTAEAMEKEREQTRELMKRKKGRAVPVTQGTRTNNARDENLPKPKTESVVVKAKDLAPSGFFASLKARTMPTARPTASTTDAASQSAGAAPTARMVGGPGQSKPKGRTTTTATTSTTNIFLPSVAKAPAKAGTANTKIKTLSHMHNVMKKQRNEPAPDISALTLFTPGSAITATSSEIYAPSKATEKVTTPERRVSFAVNPARTDKETPENASADTAMPATRQSDGARSGIASSLRASGANNTPVIPRQPDEARSGITSSLRASGANKTPVITRQPDEARSGIASSSRTAVATTTPAATRQADEAQSDFLSSTHSPTAKTLADDLRLSEYPLYTCKTWARGSSCRWGRDCAFEHYNTGHILQHDTNNIPNREITCSFWAEGHCARPASKCRFVHGETRYMARHGRLPTRLLPGDIVDGMRQVSKPDNAVVERDTISTRKQGLDDVSIRQQEQDVMSTRKQAQDAISARKQEQDAISARKQELDENSKRKQEQNDGSPRKWDLTCWYFISNSCRFRGKDCRFSHVEKKFVSRWNTGDNPIPYEHALIELNIRPRSDSRSRLPLFDGARDYDNEPLSMPRPSSPPRGPRASRDTSRDNIGRTVLPDLSVRQGTHDLAGKNPKTMSSTQHTSITTSTSLRKSRTDLIPAVLIVNPSGQAPVPIDVDLEVLLFGAQKDLFNVPEPGAEAQPPRVIQINHICAAEYAKANFDFSLKQILAKGNMLTNKANKRTIANFCETLDLNSSGAVMQHDHFALFVIPARREQWKFLGLQSPSADIQLQFVATATSRPPAAAVILQSPAAAAPMQLPVATALVQPPLTTTPAMPGTSRVPEFDALKLFDKNAEKHAFLMVHQDYARDIEILTAGLHGIEAKVYLLTEPGAWSHFCSLSSGGAVIVHHTYDTFYDVPDLAAILRQQIAVKFFSFDGNNLTDPLSPLFPHGRAVFVMDSLWEDHVDDALRLLDYLKFRLNARPETNRLVGRPDLERWLHKLKEEETDPELYKQRQELWRRVYELLHAKPEYLGRWPEPEGPTAASPVFFESGDVYADYAELYINDTAKAEDTMAEWFCLWSLRHVNHFRNFIIVSAGPQRQRTKWLNAFKHIDVQTVGMYGDLERARADHERKRKEQFDRKKREWNQQKEKERAKAA